MMRPYRRLDPDEGMVQAAEVRGGCDFSGASDWTPQGRILVQREVRSKGIGIIGILSQQATEMSLVEDDDVIEALASKGPDEAFRIAVLPGCEGCDRAVPDAHGP